jgi:hypothetical protein
MSYIWSSVHHVTLYRGWSRISDEALLELGDAMGFTWVLCGAFAIASVAWSIAAWFYDRRWLVWLGLVLSAYSLLVAGSLHLR